MPDRRLITLRTGDDILNGLSAEVVLRLHQAVPVKRPSFSTPYRIQVEALGDRHLCSVAVRLNCCQHPLISGITFPSLAPVHGFTWRTLTDYQVEINRA